MTRLNPALTLIFIGLLSFILHPAAAEPSVYKVYVDGTDGFYQVRNTQPGNITYVNKTLTLNINAGDSIRWENWDYYDWPLTIMSEQNLWDNKTGYLKYKYKPFNYTFKQPGTYGVYIEDPRVPHMTIIVAAVETPTVTTPPPTPTETETAAPTASVTQTPPGALSGFNLWYILLALIVVAGLVVFIYSLKKK